MIIYGTKPKSTVVDEGQFFCPQCNTECIYDLNKVRTYFTLYFVPLFPVGSGDEYIECRNCSGTFAPEVINYDPEVEAQATAETLRRISALFLFDVGRISETTLGATQEIVSEATDVEISREDVAQDAQHAQQANADFIKYCKTQLNDYSEAGKLLVILQLRRILESEGPLDDVEQARLRQLGKTLKLKKRDVNEFLTMDLDDVDDLEEVE